MTLPTDYPYFRGFDIARALRLMPGTSLTTPQGWILDGFGGLHPFGGAPRMTDYPYFAGNDVARQLTVG